MCDLALDKDKFNMTIEECNIKNKKIIEKTFDELFEILIYHKNINFFSNKIKEEYKNGNNTLKNIVLEKLSNIIDTNNITEEKDFEKLPLNISLYKLSNNYSSLLEIENASYIKNVIILLLASSILHFDKENKDKSNVYISEKTIDKFILSIKVVSLELWKNKEFTYNGKEFTFYDIFTDNDLIPYVREILIKNNIK